MCTKQHGGIDHQSVDFDHSFSPFGGLHNALCPRHLFIARTESAVCHGHLTRVGPYLYCNVLNLNDCQTPQSQGELHVSEDYPVQLSVPEAIERAPWRLLQIYEDPTNTATTFFRPNSRLALTIPTVDPQRGRLTGVVVQLLTLVVDNGELREAPHAEWSVRLVF